MTDGDETVSLDDIDKRLSQVEDVTKEANEMLRQVLTEQSAEIKAQKEAISDLRHSVEDIREYLMEIDERVRRLESEIGTGE
ncbi:hypothetical protein [Halosegnis sp.]|uniref:hypothetical protein n=1 Tax=Halosegnis sp. TaxID=2864959 RepID=UPI0035D48087